MSELEILATVKSGFATANSVASFLNEEKTTLYTLKIL